MHKEKFIVVWFFVVTTQKMVNVPLSRLLRRVNQRLIKYNLGLISCKYLLEFKCKIADFPFSIVVHV